jgi:hypothetical protein
MFQNAVIVEVLQVDNAIGTVGDDVSTNVKNLIYVPDNMYEIPVQCHLKKFQGAFKM